MVYGNANSAGCEDCSIAIYALSRHEVERIVPLPPESRQGWGRSSPDIVVDPGSLKRQRNGRNQVRKIEDIDSHHDHEDPDGHRSHAPTPFKAIRQISYGKDGDTDTQAQESRQQKDPDIYLGQDDRKKEGEKGEEAEAIKNCQQYLVVQPLVEKFISDPQKNEDQKEKLCTGKRGAFEIENNIAGEEAPEAKLHSPEKTGLNLLNPPSRVSPTVTSENDNDHGCNDGQVEKQDDIVEDAVDARHRKGIPYKTDAEYAKAGVFLVPPVELRESGLMSAELCLGCRGLVWG
jgi:hypothetical protein